MSLGYVFEMFNANPLRQLLVLTPILGFVIAIVWLMIRLMLRKRYQIRKIVGYYIFLTLIAYTIFIFMMILLAPTGTSYGKVQPVIIVFGVIYLLFFSLKLLTTYVLFRYKRVVNKWRTLFGSYIAAHILVLGVLFYGFYIETQWLDVTQTTIQESKLPIGTPPIRIALFSDIHMERWTSREHQVLKQLNQLAPDIIVIAGDHINIDHYTAEAYADLQLFFKQLKAPYGVYATRGGVDPSEPTRKALEGSTVRLLDDEITTVTIRGQVLSLIGVTSGIQNEDVFKTLAASLPAEALKILIYHPPDFITESAQAGIDLYLAGHTHGGQIALPFFGAVYTASRSGRAYSAGLYNLGGSAQTKLYITRGLGMEGFNTPRARLFARPELSFITLVPAPK